MKEEVRPSYILDWYFNKYNASEETIICDIIDFMHDRYEYDDVNLSDLFKAANRCLGQPGTTYAQSLLLKYETERTDG